jgi:hypothetical protein
LKLIDNDDLKSKYFMSILLCAQSNVKQRSLINHENNDCYKIEEKEGKNYKYEKCQRTTNSKLITRKTEAKRTTNEAISEVDSAQDNKRCIKCCS